MFVAVALVAAFVQEPASATGKTVVDVVSELGIRFELETPAELQRCSNQDSLRDKDA